MIKGGHFGPAQGGQFAPAKGGQFNPARGWSIYSVFRWSIWAIFPTQEYIDADYDFIYSGEEKAQIITKSTWFQLSPYEMDKNYFEYCIPFKESRSLISIVWEG